MRSKIKTIFIGTPDFGIPCLNALHDDNRFELVAVVTQPDKPCGRKMVLTPPPVKVRADELGIKVLQPEKLGTIKKEVIALDPDLIVVVAFSKLIPADLIDLPKYGSINVHPSLLPKYRGASVINAPILNGDKESGVTIMKMDAGLDTGPILTQNKIVVEQRETAGSLYEKLSEMSAKLLVSTLKKYINGEIQPIQQDHNQATYAKELKKSDGKIHWGKPADEIERLVRGMHPWPGTFTKASFTRKKQKYDYHLKITEVDPAPVDALPFKVGEVFEYGNRMAVQCGDGALVINKLQPEGKKEMKSEEFLCGNSEIIGTILH